ncbi:MAG: class I SAM-dependent methyltransferase [Desulfobacteraceae bacterium]|nr:MAG: class I SAM-dependent methyltransferase [Desulfobacteraceae bacterium]
MEHLKKVFKSILKKITPSRSLNLRSAKQFRKLADLLIVENNAPRVLVVGGRILGCGIHELLDIKSIQVLETDIQIGPRTALICDAHALPFRNRSFDAVIIQAVLEHVFDPVQCVKEISRVLPENGYVYAETPFMQQVHDAPYDFHRFTYLGHRRLFRQFSEIASGPVAGPGTVLCWAYVFFLSSFSDHKYLKAVLMRIALFTGFWIKYFDYFLINKKGSMDGASVYYFLGHKCGTCLSDQELISSFR